MQWPKTWSIQELEADARRAAEEFRRARLAEPLARYSGVFGEFCPLFREMIE